MQAMHPTVPSLLRTAAVAAALLTAGATTAQAAPVTLSTAQDTTDVAAHDGTIVWSERNPETGRFRLVKSVGGGTPEILAGVPEYREAFDVDLGTNTQGKLYAIYTRDGFIHRAPVDGGAEKRLTYISLGGTNHSPSMHAGRIAFIHGQRGKDSLRYTTSASRKPRSLRTGVFDDVELGARHIAYTEVREKGRTQLVRLRNVRTGRDAVLYKARSGGLNQADVTGPTFTEDGAAVVWARTNVGSGTGNRVVKYTLRGSKLSYAAGNPRYATSAWAGGALGLAFSTALEAKGNAGCEDAGVQYCGVGATGELTFSTRP